MSCSYTLLNGQNGVEDVVPELARHAEGEVEVLVVVREMILLQLANVGRESRVMEAVETSQQTSAWR